VNTLKLAYAPAPFVPGQSPVPVAGKVVRRIPELGLARRFVAGLVADDGPLQRRLSRPSVCRVHRRPFALTVNSGSSANLDGRA
jgi:CDP-6-deoxy-D-xylo-4-hexulose-3-dehydrase